MQINDRDATEVENELRYHVELLTERFKRMGLDDREARRRARIEFGGLQQIKEECLDVRSTPKVATLRQRLLKLVGLA